MIRQHHPSISKIFGTCSSKLQQSVWNVWLSIKNKISTYVTNFIAHIITAQFWEITDSLVPYPATSWAAWTVALHWEENWGQGWWAWSPSLPVFQGLTFTSRTSWSLILMKTKFLPRIYWKCIGWAQKPTKIHSYDYWKTRRHLCSLPKPNNCLHFKESLFMGEWPWSWEFNMFTRVRQQGRFTQ